MPEYVPVAFADAMRRGGGNLAVFMRVATEPTPLRLVVGTDSVPLQQGVLDDQQEEYLGSGRLLSIPDFEVMLNGMADVIELSMNGIAPELVAKLAATAPNVLGAVATIAVGVLDERYQLQGDTFRIWSGTADFWSEKMDPGTDPKAPQLMRIGLTLQSGDSSRAFASLATFTDLSQQTLHPGDRFCERTSRYLTGISVAWP